MACIHPLHALPESGLVGEILHTDALTRCLVGVGGADAPSGSAYLALAQPPLLHVVEQDVIGHDEVGPGRHFEPGGRHTPGFEIVDLLAKDGGVDDHPVANDGDDPGVEDPGGDQVERELAQFVLDCVPGVVAALVADHHVGLLAEQIDDFAFAFIAPLGAHHDENRHLASRMSRSQAHRHPGRPQARGASSGRGPLTVYTRPTPSRSAAAWAATNPDAEACTSPRVTPAPSPTAYSPEMGVSRLASRASREE